MTALPPTLHVERHDSVAVLTIDRAEKANSLDDITIRGIGAFFTDPPTWVRSVVLQGAGQHFSAGLDLGELAAQDVLAAWERSRTWHRAFDALELGRVPVVAVLKGAVVGGGLELAAAAHLRVAESSAYFALPEGQRALFVGGGGSVRLPRLIGTHRMADMMLTGRVHHGDEAEQLGFAHYSAKVDAGLPRAIELASSMAEVAPLTTMAVLQALPRIADTDRDTGFLMESLVAAAASSSPEAQQRAAEFLAGRATKVGGSQK